MNPSNKRSAHSILTCYISKVPFAPMFSSFFKILDEDIFFLIMSFVRIFALLFLKNNKVKFKNLHSSVNFNRSN